MNQLFYIYFIFSKDSKSKFDNSVRYKTEDEPENGKKLNKVEFFFRKIEFLQVKEDISIKGFKPIK